MVPRPLPLRVGDNRPDWLRRVDLVTRYSNPDVLHFLAKRGAEGALTPEVRSVINVTRSQAARILNSLEKTGLVRGVREGDPGHGPGKGTRWFTRREAVLKTVDDLRAYIVDGRE